MNIHISSRAKALTAALCVLVAAGAGLAQNEAIQPYCQTEMVT